MAQRVDVLAPPSAWRDELASALAPTPRPRAHRLSMGLTQTGTAIAHLEQHGATLPDLATDLAGGASCCKRGRKYVLSGRRFSVELAQQVRQDNGARLAMMRAVRPSTDDEPLSAAVTATFHPASASVDCDLAAMQQTFDDAGPSRQALRARAAKALAGAVEPPPGDRQLIAQVDQQYTTLMTLLKLLRHRNAIEGGAKIIGRVVELEGATADAGELLWVRGERTGAFPADATVDLRIGGRKRGWRLELVRIEEDDLVCLEAPPVAIAPGTEAIVEYQPDFALKRHLEALDDFLNRRIEGDWTALAQLLCAPASLPGADVVPLPSFYDEALNGDQRAAVAGALAAPKAFFVQGPPGTGKTTVITEIVRQLVARGERVLLLAPMHVAVDEVLRRVGDAPGVFALRTSYSDAKVRPDLQRFLPQNVAAEFVRRARRPEYSKAARWREDAARAADEAAAIRRYVEARRTLAGAEAQRRKAQSDRAAGIEMRSAERLRLGAETAAAQGEITPAQTHAHMAEQRRLQAAQALEEGRAQRSLGSRIGGLVGLGEQARRERELFAAAAAAQAADSDVRARAERLQRARTAESSFGEWTASRQHAEDVECQEAERALETWSSAAAVACAAARAAGGGADPAALNDAVLERAAAQRELRASRLESYIHLERRWFELVGLTDAGTPADQRARMSTLGQQLLRGANLVCCTTTGFGGDRIVSRMTYDTLIVDEASRVIDSAFLIGARRARRWVLVGDEHQLPPHVELKDEHHLHALAALHMAKRNAAPDLVAAIRHLADLWREDEELHQFRVPSVLAAAERLQVSGKWRWTFEQEFRRAYARLGEEGERAMLGAMREHLVRSLFERCVGDCSPRVRHRLVEQRRMIEPIARIVREPVYQGRYRTAPASELEQLGVTPLIGGRFTRPVVFLDTSDQPSARELPTDNGFVNELEAAWIVKCCRIWDRQLARLGVQRLTVSVLSFYAAQAREIARRLDYPRCRDFQALHFEVVDAIDRIQGQESELVFLSFCRTRRGRGRMGPDYGRWLQDVRRLNVACTRARRALVLAGHRQTLEQLCGNPAAVAFYRNLFDLVDGSDDVLVLKHIDVR